MATKNDGGPAFPTSHDCEYTGMSLRDWIAGQTLAGLVNSSLIREEAIATNERISDVVARSAFRIADAMIAARDAK